MANQMFYFGTAERMAWLPCPNTGMTANLVKWRTSGTFLNGGAYTRSSSTGHLEYSMAWPVMSTDDAYSLLDYFNGMYGEGPYYFLDPMAMAFNILPSWLAEPRLQTQDAPTMVTGVTPTLSSLVAVTNGYPGRTASYTLTASQTGVGFTFPVPPGYAFRFGWHGTASGTARVRVVGSTTVDTSPISSTGSNVRFNTTVLPDANGFVTISLIGGASGGTLALRGLSAIVTPATGPATRTNLLLNPRLGTGVSGWSQQLGTGEAATLTRITGAVDGPISDISTYYRKTVTTAKTAGSSGIFERDTGTITGLTGEVITGSLYVRPSITLDVRCSLTPRLAGVASGAASNGLIVTCPAGVWTRITTTHTTTAAWDSVQVWASESTTLPVGATMDVTGAQLERYSVMTSYLDGALPDTNWSDYEWTGTANASYSIERILAANLNGNFASGRGNSGVTLR
jgi:hypothetical protein